MCGIIGSFSLIDFFSHEDINCALQQLAHRGPDGDGIFSDEFVKLGHKRLSIIDLDKRSAQPMYSDDGRYVMVFNGEIYNYIELKEDIIKAHGNTSFAEFKTTSDSEVVLRLFEIYGEKFVDYLNGMFAVVIYDRHLKRLYLFRDRLGIKPLFYWSDEARNFCFASELKAIKAIEKIKQEIDYNAVFSYLQLGFVPAPYSIYLNIRKLRAGHFLIVDENGFVEKPYWTLSTSMHPASLDTETAVLNLLEQKLTEAVRLQLRSDVPYGVFLSGGIDSSTLSAIASKIVAKKLNTFSIGFEEQSHNESHHAKAVAKALGTSHHEFIVSYKDAIGMVENFFDVYDEPYSDTSGIPTMLVSKLAAQHVKVVLSGEGGDELFFGYGTHNWASRLSNPFLQLMKIPMAKLFENLSSRHKRIAALLNYGDVFLPQHIYSQEQYYFNNKELSGLLSQRLIQAYNSFANRNVVELSSEFVYANNYQPAVKQSLYEIAYTLPDDLLTKVDRATMHYSIEARVPFLDHHVVEFAMSINPQYKIKNGENKYILKQLLYRYLSRDLFDRPKQGFSIPLAKWLMQDWHYLLHNFLNEDVVRHAGFVEYAYVQKLRQQFESGAHYLYNRLWNLVVLHRWFIKENTK